MGRNGAGAIPFFTEVCSVSSWHLVDDELKTARRAVPELRTDPTVAAADAHNARARSDFLALGASGGDTRTLLTTALFTNASFCTLLGTLYLGGTCFVQERFDPCGFIEVVEHEQINRCFLVPVQFKRILPCVLAAPLPLCAIARLRGRETNAAQGPCTVRRRAGRRCARRDPSARTCSHMPMKRFARRDARLNRSGSAMD